MCRIATLLLAVAVASASSARVVSAQPNFEIQVYPSKTADKHTTLFELHSNFTGDGSRLADGTVLPSQHAVHETLEITHGFSDIFEVGLYLFAAREPGRSSEFVGTHIRPRIMVPESWKLPVGLSLSTEVGPVSTKYDANNIGVEFRPIIDQTIGKFYWAINPTVGWSVKGPDAGKGTAGMGFEPNVKVAYTVVKQIAVGLEYYGATGSITRLAPMREQEHVVYPSIDLFLSEDWETNIGYGLRVAGTGDHNVFKLIVGRRFGW
jgi:hypothetical protein